MQEHINQALHNDSFVIELSEKFPDSYFDWKVTATFYTALHLLRAFCQKRGVDPGNTHYDIANSFDPRKCNNKPITQCPKYVWECYNKLQKYSEHARYEVFLNAAVENEIQRDNFEECKKHLETLRTYFNAQGVPCIIEKAA